MKNSLRLLGLGLLLLSLGACGGKGAPESFSNPAGLTGGQRITSERVVLTVLPDSYIAGGKAAAFEVSERQGQGEILVDVQVRGADRLKAFFFHLEFDPARYSVGRLDNPWLLGPESECLALFLSDPGAGVVEFGELLMLPQEARADGTEKGFSGDGLLCTLHLKTGPATGGRKPSAAPDSDGAASTLAYDSEAQTLEWQHFSPGDYNQDGQVAVSDLTPIGIHFNKDVPAGSDPDGRDAASIEDVVDGSNDGKVNVSDLTAIGLNFQDRVSSYNIYQGALADLPASNSGANGAGAQKLATIPFNQNSGNAGTARIGFSHVLGPLPGNTVYWVRPNDSADGSGADGTASSPLDSSLFNQPPKAQWTGPFIPFDQPPAEAVFIVANCFDPDGSIVLFEFDAEGDGIFEQTFTENPVQINHNYEQPGLWIATLRVTDDDDAQTTTSWDTEVRDPTNQGPSLDMQVSPLEGPAPLAVHIDLSGSSDPDGSIVKYEIDARWDGEYELITTEGGVLDYVFFDAGSYYIYCRVTDNLGSRATDIKQVVVTDDSNLAPVADLQADVTSGDFPLEVSFDASASFDTDGTVETYIWDFFGDGSEDLKTAEPFTSFTYSTEGLITARVTAVDNDQIPSVADSVEIQVNGGWKVSPVKNAAYLGTATRIVPVVDEGPTVKPLVVWLGTGNQGGDLYCSLGDENGANFSSASTIVGDCSGEFDLLTLGGFAALAYDASGINGLYFMRAEDVGGTQWAAPVAIDTSDFFVAGFGVSLDFVDGFPAVAYNPINSATLYRRATDALGDTWADATLMQLDQSTIHPHLIGDLARPVVVSQEFNSLDGLDSLLAYPANDALGGSFNSPTDLGHNLGLHFSTTGAGDRAFVAHSNFNLLYSSRSADADATAWEQPVLVASPPEVAIGEISMSTIAGKPAVAFELNPGQLWYCEATDSSGAQWQEPACAWGGAPVLGIHLAAWNNRPAISFATGSSGGIYFAFLP
ncbi:PKD domain-containing protein [bacterium]|nr:PKD domain-containing protein [bacterium]